MTLPAPAKLTAFLCLATALQSQAVMAAVVPDLTFERYHLDNGLEVLLHRDAEVPIVHLEVWYKVGSKDEAPGKTGLAHLVEHMMFEGSKHIGEGGFFKYLSEAGASAHNGATDTDHTRYYETLPASQLERGLWLESSRMGFLLDRPNLANALARQRDVVKNERRQEVENVPLGGLDRMEREALFPPGHPYRHEVVGSMADLQAASVGDLRDFFNRYYTPNNAVLLVAGDFDSLATKALIQKYFGPIVAGPALPRPTVPPIPLAQAERRIDMEARISLPEGCMAWNTVAVFQPGDAEMDMLATILAGDRTSRLYNRLVYQLKIAESVSATHTSRVLGGTLEITYTAMKGHSLGEIESVIDDELRRLQSQPPTADEVERARNQIETDSLAGLEGLAGLGGRLLYYDIFAGNPGYLSQDLQRYDRASSESLAAWAKRILTKAGRVTVDVAPYAKAPIMGRLAKAVSFDESNPSSVLPGQKDWPTTVAARISPDAPFRWSFPPVRATRPFRVPTVKRFRLANGLAVILAESHKLPLVSVNLTLKSGNGANPPGKAGLASLVAEMLDEGTRNRTATQIAKQIAQLGASLTTDAWWDTSIVSLSCLASNLARALPIWSDVLLDPVFADADRARVIENWLSFLADQHDSPAAVADRVFARVLWGDHDAFAWPLLGTAASLKGIRREDLKAFYAAYYAPDHAVLTVSGDITEKEVRTKIEPLLASWRTRSLPVVRARQAVEPQRRRIVLVATPGTSQSSVRIGLPGIDQSSPDYERVLVTNRILGGPFKRLDMNLRESKGWTYGVGCHFEARRSVGPWVISGEFAATHTADAVAEILREIRRLGREEVTDRELADAKDEIVGELPTRLATADQLASEATALAVYDLPATHLEGLTKRIAAVGAAEVRKTAQRYLRADEMLVVVVGDRGRTEAALRRLGEIELRDADGNVVLPPRVGSRDRTPDLSRPQ